MRFNAKMAMKLNSKIEFCGKERKFKRCPNKLLKDYQKSIEDMQEEMIPLAKRTRDFQFKITELEDEIGSIDKRIELLEKLDDASDKEIRDCMDLVSKKTDLQKEIHKLRKENDDAELKDNEVYKDLEDKLRESYATFAHEIFEDFDVDEIDEADSTDLTIAPRLSEVYRLAMTGAKQKEIDKLYAKIIKDSFS